MSTKSTSQIKIEHETKANASDVKILDAVMSKAEFTALAEERKANRPGSGFDHMGKHDTSFNPVNEGITTRNDQVNTFFLGEREGQEGVSKTIVPIISVNGISCKIGSVNHTDVYNKISLPDAPKVTHADSSNSGMVVNGRNMIDTSGYSASSSVLTAVDGRLRVTTSAIGVNAYANQSIATEIGVEYIIEIKPKLGTSANNARLKIGTTENDGNILDTGHTIGTERKEYKFIATSTTTWLGMVVYDGTASGVYHELEELFMCPSHELSRADLVFVEVYHEDISEKDFVYPLGNIQYLGVDTDGLTGIVAGAFTGKETYSLFGNWQVSNALVGKGYVWSTMSEADKIAFVSNPLNNCYKDGTTIVQVRYRFRVVQGLGDEWENIDPQRLNTYLSYKQSNAMFVEAKGKSTSIVSDFRVGNGNILTSVKHTDTNLLKDMPNGIFSTRTDNTISYSNCHVLPIALVYRRNQGVYHPKFNPNGTKTLLSEDGTNSSGIYWFSTTARKPQNISNCFTYPTGAYPYADGFTTDSIGDIDSGTSNVGRPDGLFYDEVHESDIKDLRIHSENIKDYKRLLEREFNKAVAGTVRGSEGECESFKAKLLNPALSTTNTFLTEGSLVVNGVVRKVYKLLNHYTTDFLIFFVGADMYRIIDWDANAWHPVIDKWDGAAWVRGDFTSVLTANIEVTIFPSSSRLSYFDDFTPLGKSTRKKSNTLTHIDIIGNPTNYYRGQDYITKGTKQVVTTAIGDVIWFKNASANVVLTGSIDATASTAVVGVGTLFTTELNVGDSILVSGEERIVATITDDLNLTVTVAFTDTLNDTSPEQVGKGTGTVGNFYKALTVQTDVDLNQELFATDTTNWEDLGADWDGPGSWRTGISGTPLVVGENGEDYISTGVNYPTIKLSKKASTFKFGLYSADNGATWTYVGGPTFNSTTNTIIVDDPTISGRLWLAFYETHTNMTENAVNSEVIELGDVFANCHADNAYGVHLLSSLTNKINTYAGGSKFQSYSPLLEHGFAYGRLASAQAFAYISHKPLELADAATHGTKVFDYLTRENGKAYLNLVFKEMKFDVTWGDDSKFDIIDNISTTTDDNGNTVLIGQKRIELPYFIEDKE